MHVNVRLQKGEKGENDSPKPIKSLIETELITNVRHQCLNFTALFRCQRQQRQSRASAVVSIQIARIFDCRDAEMRANRRAGRCDSLLFLDG